MKVGDGMTTQLVTGRIYDHMQKWLTKTNREPAKLGRLRNHSPWHERVILKEEDYQAYIRSCPYNSGWCYI